MKVIITLISLLLLVHSFSQSESGTSVLIPVKDEQILEFCDVEAQFPGGKVAMKKYFEKNIILPSEARQVVNNETIWVEFVVEIDGALTQIEVVKGDNFYLKEEALRLIREMPTWDSAYISQR
jgi:Gram-negative bacterial TonB protein C-terminal